MNLKDAIKSKNVEDHRDPLMAEEWWEAFRARDPRTNKYAMPNRSIQDNRLDKMQSIYADEEYPGDVEGFDNDADDADPEYDPEAEDAQYETEFPDYDSKTGKYKNNAEFQFPEDKVQQLMQGEQMPSASVNNDMLMQILERLSGPDGGAGGDASMEYAEQLMGGMKGTDLSLDDIMATIAGGGAGGRGHRMQSGMDGIDPRALIEAAMAEKVTGRMEGDGFFGKNQSRIGGLDEPRKKIGKGEQRVNRKDAKYNQDGSEATAAEKKDRNASSKYKKKNQKDDD